MRRPRRWRRPASRQRGATLYVTLEPCSHYGKTPPCADAIVAAGVARVVSAIEDPNPDVGGRGHARIRDAGVALDVGICADEARHDHAGHIRRITTGRPYVTLKLALSADEKIGAAGRRPVAITGEEVRTRVHMFRAQSDAILIGVGTAAGRRSAVELPPAGHGAAFAGAGHSRPASAPAARRISRAHRAQASLVDILRHRRRAVECSGAGGRGRRDYPRSGIGGGRRSVCGAGRSSPGAEFRG